MTAAPTSYAEENLIFDEYALRYPIGQPATVEELETLSSKKRTARLDAIKAACQEYIQGPDAGAVERAAAADTQTANLNADRPRVEADPDDPDGQSLFPWYSTTTAEGNAYTRHAHHGVGPDQDSTLAARVATASSAARRQTFVFITAGNARAILSAKPKLAATCASLCPPSSRSRIKAQHIF